MKKIIHNANSQEPIARDGGSYTLPLIQKANSSRAPFIKVAIFIFFLGISGYLWADTNGSIVLIGDDLTVTTADGTDYVTHVDVYTLDNVLVTWYGGCGLKSCTYTVSLSPGLYHVVVSTHKAKTFSENIEVD